MGWDGGGAARSYSGGSGNMPPAPPHNQIFYQLVANIYQELVNTGHSMAISCRLSVLLDVDVFAHTAECGTAGGSSLLVSLEPGVARLRERGGTALPSTLPRPQCVHVAQMRN